MVLFRSIERTVRYLPVVMPAGDLEDEERSAIEAMEHVAEQTERGVFPRAPTACMTYGRPCEFMIECYPHRARMIQSVAEEKQEEGGSNGEG